MSENPWLDYVSCATNVVLAGCALYALKQIRAAIEQVKLSAEQTKTMADQLKIAREDVEIRYTREATKVTLDQCARWASRILPELNRLSDGLVKAGYTFPKDANPSFTLARAKQDPHIQKIWGTQLRLEVLAALNEAESFAMYFTSGLADESIAFPPVAQGYCQLCQGLASFIGVHRPENSVQLYPNLVRLYEIWASRLEHEKLNVQQRNLDAQKSGLPPTKKSKPIRPNLSND